MSKVLFGLVIFAILLSFCCKCLPASDPITHSVVGGYLGYFLAKDPGTALLLGVVSHAILDMLPHYQFPQIRENLFCLGLPTLFISFKLYQNMGENEKVLWGALGGILPDADRWN